MGIISDMEAFYKDQKEDAERYRFLKTLADFDRALESYCGVEIIDIPDDSDYSDYTDASIDKAMGKLK